MVFEAKGGERFFIIGNFNNDKSTVLSQIGSTGSRDFSYVFIDDVSIEEKCSLPVFELPYDTTLCSGQQININLSNTKADSYLWQDGKTDSNYTITQTGNYYLTLTNSCGSVSDTLNVMFDNCNCNNYILPNAFSPNGNGVNDYFFPISDCNPETFQLLIYNRWGILVYSSVNFNEKWDGSCNGTPCSNDVYFYTLRYKMPYKAAKQTEGTLTLLR